MRLRQAADRRLMRAPIAILAAAALLAGCSQLSDTDDGANDPAATAAPAVASTPGHAVQTAGTDAGQPTDLAIPTLGVDAPVVDLGTAPDGSQDVPDSLSTVGWWRDGSRPGQSGNAVFVGHTASRTDGVFDDLGALKPGDRILVQADQPVTFTVTRTYEVTNADFADVAPQIYRTVGSPGIVLMTCSTWNGSAYETTTVVHGRLSNS